MPLRKSLEPVLEEFIESEADTPLIFPTVKQSSPVPRNQRPSSNKNNKQFNTISDSRPLNSTQPVNYGQYNTMSASADRPNSKHKSRGDPSPHMTGGDKAQYQSVQNSQNQQQRQVMANSQTQPLLHLNQSALSSLTQKNLGTPVRGSSGSGARRKILTTSQQ